MLSLAQTPVPSHLVSSTVDRVQAPLDVSDFADVEEALESFVKLTSASVAPSQSVTLKCNLPTWSLGSDLDLHDLRALHARSLLLIHKLVDRLSAAGIQATYKLTMSSRTSYTVIRVFKDSSVNDVDAVCSQMKRRSAPVSRERVYQTTIGEIPTLIMT